MAQDPHARRAASWPWDQELPTLTLSRLWKLGAKAMGDAKRGLARVLPEDHPAHQDEGYAAYLAISGLLDQARLSDVQLGGCLSHILERAAFAASIVDEDDGAFTVDAGKAEAVINGVCAGALAGHRLKVSGDVVHAAVH